jgi:hypothetical protein
MKFELIPQVRPIIPVSATGYAALFEIASPSISLLLALWRQRSEADLQRR